MNKRSLSPLYLLRINSSGLVRKHETNIFRLHLIVSEVEGDPQFYTVYK